MTSLPAPPSPPPQGLRQEMVYAQAHAQNPEFFDCPLAMACKEEYTFKEVCASGSESVAVGERVRG